jgi:hypothetical protein
VRVVQNWKDFAALACERVGGSEPEGFTALALACERVGGSVSEGRAAAGVRARFAAADFAAAAGVVGVQLRRVSRGCQTCGNGGVG